MVLIGGLDWIVVVFVFRVCNLVDVFFLGIGVCGGVLLVLYLVRKGMIKSVSGKIFIRFLYSERVLMKIV